VAPAQHEIDFKAPYKRVTMTQSIIDFTGFDITRKSEEELYEAAKGMGVSVDKTMGKGKLIDEIFGEKCEGNYIEPTFITDYPKEMSPLCKEHREDPELTERFELMVCGKEIANAYSELNDPIDQRERFISLEGSRRIGNAMSASIEARIFSNTTAQTQLYSLRSDDYLEFLITRYF